MDYLTVTNLSEFTESIPEATDKRLHMNVIYTDLSKASERLHLLNIINKIHCHWQLPICRVQFRTSKCLFYISMMWQVV